MKVYPLIYSRTKLCDYVHGFLARPENLDYNLAAKYATEAMYNIKDADGIRHAVFSVGDFIIYGGTACIAPSLVKHIIKHKTIDFDFQAYQEDKSGRPLVFFIGFAVLKSELDNNKVPDIDLYTTYKIYLRYLKEQWDAATTKTHIITMDEPLKDIGLKDAAPIEAIEFAEFEGRRFIKNYNEENFQAYIDYFFIRIKNGENIAFLSQVSASDAETENHYNVLSISDRSADSFVTSLKAKRTIQPKTPSTQIDDDVYQKIRRPEPPVEDEKKNFPLRRLILLILLALAIVAISMILLVHNANKKKQTAQAQQKISAATEEPESAPSDSQLKNSSLAPPTNM